jgi:hypothetical protein
MTSWIIPVDRTVRHLGLTVAILQRTPANLSQIDQPAAVEIGPHCGGGAD